MANMICFLFALEKHTFAFKQALFHESTQNSSERCGQDERKDQVPRTSELARVCLEFHGHFHCQVGSSSGSIPKSF